MTEVPKIVHDRLRAGLPDQTASGAPHPDADLLTAFAEQALSGAERDGVLGHLALCGDCREVVALALPTETVAAPRAAGAEGGEAATGAKEPGRRRLAIFAWPTLRWAALAAGVALAASVLLLRPAKQNVAVLSPAAPPVTATAPPVAEPQTAQPMDRIATLTRTDVAKSKTELSLPKKLKAEESAPRPVPAESGILIADAKTAGNKKDSGQSDKPAADAPTGIRAFHYDASASRKTTEAVEVSGAAVAVEEAPAAEGNVMARNEVPAIEKAKAALPGLEVDQQQKIQAAAAPAMARAKAMSGANAGQLEHSAKAALIRNAIWRIAAGALQRSLDSGQTWQNTFHADHPLLCYASQGEDVWTGGQAGTLFHSANGGLTWTQVQPAIKDQPLTADITRIDVRGPAEVVVSTSNHETWTTTEGGKTWEKQ